MGLWVECTLELTEGGHMYTNQCFTIIRQSKSLPTCLFADHFATSAAERGSSDSEVEELGVTEEHSTSLALITFSSVKL
jgi:hypothetical protein